MENQAFEKLSITLPAEMAKVIRERVNSGGYGSASEVIREAMRAWLERQRLLASLDNALARGAADIEAGRVVEIDELRKQLRAYRSESSSGS